MVINLVLNRNPILIAIIIIQQHAYYVFLNDF